MANKRVNQAELAALADEDLMALAQTGELQAFELIYDRHSRAAYSLAYRVVGGFGAADDVVQEAFLSVWRSVDRYDASRSSVRTWVLRIVHRRAIDLLRSHMVHARRRSADEEAGESVETGERIDTDLVRRDDASTVRSALAGLPPEQSKIIELAFFSGFTHSQISELLDLPIGTVKGRMRLGLNKLRTALESSGVLSKEMA